MLNPKYSTLHYRENDYILLYPPFDGRLIRKVGTWTVNTRSGAILDRTIYSSTKGDKLQVVLKNVSAISVIGVIRPDGGILTAKIDGVSVKNMDFYYPSEQLGIAFLVYRHFADGLHLFEFEISGANENSTGNVVEIETIAVQGIGIIPTVEDFKTGIQKTLYKEETGSAAGALDTLSIASIPSGQAWAINRVEIETDANVDYARLKVDGSYITRKIRADKVYDRDLLALAFDTIEIELQNSSTDAGAVNVYLEYTKIP